MDAILLFIKKLRAGHGLTQGQMAEKIHLSLKGWQKIENGNTKLDLERLAQIAEILGTSLVELITNVYADTNKNTIFSTRIMPKRQLPAVERRFYESIIADKDKEIEFYRRILESELVGWLKEKMINQ